MNVQTIKSCIQNLRTMNPEQRRVFVETEATYAGERIRAALADRKKAYVSGQLLDANKELKDVFQGAQLEQMLNKTGEKSSKVWSVVNAVPNFLAKHSDKIIAKAGLIAAGAVVAVIGAAHVVKNAKSAEETK